MNFLGRFSKPSQISNFIKNHAFGGELFSADGYAEREADTEM
jgi:hypothetical protein